MAGTKGRSGGRNKNTLIPTGDGPPMSPRALSPRSAALFAWLCDKLHTDDPASTWSRVDGVCLASLSELLETQEKVASQLADSPGDLGLMRVRIQVAAQIARMSATIGLTPIDRARLPQALPVDEETNAFDDIMARMSRG